MTAQRLFLLSAGIGLLSVFPAAADDGARLHSLRSVDTTSSLFLAMPPDPGGLTKRDMALATLAPVTSSAPALTPVALALDKAPQGSGANLWGLVREPRASSTTPAGVRMVDPLALRLRSDKR